MKITTFDHSKLGKFYAIGAPSETEAVIFKYLKDRGIESAVIAHSIITRGRVIHQSRNPAARTWFTLNQTSKNRNLWDLRLLAEKSA